MTKYKIIKSDKHNFETLLENFLNKGWRILRSDVDEWSRDNYDSNFAQKRIIYILEGDSDFIDLT